MNNAKTLLTVCINLKKYSDIILQISNKDGVFNELQKKKIVLLNDKINKMQNLLSTDVNVDLAVHESMMNDKMIDELNNEIELLYGKIRELSENPKPKTDLAKPVQDLAKPSQDLAKPLQETKSDDKEIMIPIILKKHTSAAVVETKTKDIRADIDPKKYPTHFPIALKKEDLEDVVVTKKKMKKSKVESDSEPESEPEPTSESESEPESDSDDAPVVKRRQSKDEIPRRYLRIKFFGLTSKPIIQIGAKLGIKPVPPKKTLTKARVLQVLRKDEKLLTRAINMADIPY